VRPKVTIPTELGDWTYAVIVELLESHCFEDTRFDWKEILVRKDERLQKNAVGMANGAGGFFIFGVRDGRGLATSDRIAGVELTGEIPRDIGGAFQKADPSIPYRTLQPPIKLPSRDDRIIVVVQVLSTSSPHSLDGVFYKRTQSSAEKMSTEEVRALFAKTEDIRARVRLLLFELDAADTAARIPKASADFDTHLPLRRIDTRLLAELHAELAPALQQDGRISKRLAEIRIVAEKFNFMLDQSIPFVMSKQLNFRPDSGNAEASKVRTELKSLMGSFHNSVREVIEWIALAFGETPPPVTDDRSFLQR